MLTEQACLPSGLSAVWMSSRCGRVVAPELSLAIEDGESSRPA